jgi:nitroreductase
MAPVTLDQVDDLIRSRRSSLRIDPERPVNPELIERLCELATWAPNHKRTSPWRFAVLTNGARTRLGEAVADALVRSGVTDSQPLQKALTKYLRAPVIVIVGSARNEDPVLDGENRDAVAAGVQTLLLAASTTGLSTFWSTGSTARIDEVKELAGFDRDVQIVAVIYMGWPDGEAPPGRREPARINWLSA